MTASLFSGNSEVKYASDISLVELKIKGFKASQVPSTKEEQEDLLGNYNSYKHCIGAPDMSWISSADIYIKNVKTGHRVVLASWAGDHDNLDCVMTFEMDPYVNIKDFMPEFKVEVEATGVAPKNDTYLGGFSDFDISL
jgi:hypothetical protein